MPICHSKSGQQGAIDGSDCTRGSQLGVPPDIEALLLEAEAQLAQVRVLYEESLRLQTVSTALRVKVKNVLENQRSALEYLAYAIATAVANPGRSVHYPLAPEITKFDASIDSRMPGVRLARPDVAAAIAMHQPFQPGHQWLSSLRDLTNENKHQRLTPQVRAESLHISAGPGGGYVGTPGGTGIGLGQGASIILGPGASISFGGPGPILQQNINHEVIVDWLFDPLGVSALATLEEIQRNLRPAIDDVVQIAGL